MRCSIYIYVDVFINTLTYIHCKNKIVKITNLLVITDARNNCNLIGHEDCYGYTCNYKRIIVISISLCCLIDVQSRISILIEPF